MPAAIAPALILKRGTDNLTLVQLHELQANEPKVQKIIAAINEARDIALATQQAAAQARADLDTAAVAKAEDWRQREEAVAAAEKALKDKREADRLANEAAAEALKEMRDLARIEAARVETGQRTLAQDRIDFEAACADRAGVLDTRAAALTADRTKLDLALADVAKAQAEAETGLARAEKMFQQLRDRETALRAALGVGPAS